MFLKFQVWLVGTLLWLSACVYGTKSPINCICYSHWADEEEKSRPLLDPVYHVLYNYHVYWIFIFTVTKEPSAHSNSLQLSSDISCETLGTDQSNPTPPSITQLKADMTYPSRSLKPFCIFIYVFVSSLAPVLENYSKIIPKLVPSCILDCSSCFPCISCQKSAAVLQFSEQLQKQFFFRNLFCFSPRYINNRPARHEEQHCLYGTNRGWLKNNDRIFSDALFTQWVV